MGYRRWSYPVGIDIAGLYMRCSLAWCRNPMEVCVPIDGEYK